MHSSKSGFLLSPTLNHSKRYLTDQLLSDRCSVNKFKSAVKYKFSHALSLVKESQQSYPCQLAFFLQSLSLHRDSFSKLSLPSKHGQITFWLRSVLLRKVQ